VLTIALATIKRYGGIDMKKDVREMLNDFMNGLGELGETNGENVNAFMGLLGKTYEEGALNTKTKELISVGIAAYNRCEYCIVFHVYKALEAGATRAEIMEAAMVSVAFGGGPSMAYSVTLLKDAVDEFEKDFN
jgi:AhpD family alkylhydroperoxidase